MKLLYFILFNLYLRECGAFRQEFAKISYYNPKYVKNPKAVTSRSSRSQPYRTNATGTILHAWGNNVTFQIVYSIAGTGTEFMCSNTVCNIVKYDWIMNILKSCSVKVTCPMPAKCYSFYNIEFPPKNFNLPLPSRDTHLKVAFYVTATMEPMLEISLHIKKQ